MFLLQKEIELMQSISVIDDEIEKLHEKKQLKLQYLESEIILKNLLYETGKPLEEAIIKALIILGFEAKPYKDKHSEFDVIFESSEGRLLGEAEGKDKKAIGIDKLRQLEMNIGEDYEREEVDTEAKGALFGNAYRLIPPADRTEFFTDKCISSAGRKKTALIRTTDLFEVARYLSENDDPDFAAECRIAILESVGLVKFSQTPK